MKQLVALLFAIQCFNIQYTQAQKKSNYIATDSSANIGVKLVHNSPKKNSQYIKIRTKGDEEIKYTPEQIKEYGFADGSVYESIRIRINDEEKKVFLERLVKGNLTLYRYIDKWNRTYYIKKDSSDLVELHPDMQSLKQISQDCEFMADKIKLASYTKPSLQKLVSHYNRCGQQPFPYKKFGILVGWRRMTLVQPDGFNDVLLNNISIPSSGSAMVGFFADLPVEMSEFSFRPELFYSQNKFEASKESLSSDVDVLISLSTLQMPMLFRYTIPTSRLRPFFNAGPYFSYNIENSSHIYHSTITNDVITIESPVHQKLVDDLMFGYSAGLGLQHNVNFRKTLSGEIRYTWAKGQTKSTLIQNAVDIMVGFTF